MQNKSKSIAVAAVLVTIVASIVFISLPSVLAEETSTLTLNRQGIRQAIQKRSNIGWRFLKNGTPKTVLGEVSAVTRSILVLNDGNKTINVIMPQQWLIDAEVLSSKDLFDGEPFDLSEEAAIETLKLEMIKDTHVVTSYFAYSIEVDGKTATAVLPINIELIEIE